jgi:hypothetical protein
MSNITHTLASRCRPVATIIHLCRCPDEWIESIRQACTYYLLSKDLRDHLWFLIRGTIPATSLAKVGRWWLVVLIVV